MKTSDANAGNEIIFELQDRIDKAIEYIEDNSTDTYLLKSFDIDMLLEILKGGE